MILSIFQNSLLLAILIITQTLSRVQGTPHNIASRNAGDFKKCESQKPERSKENKVLTADGIKASYRHMQFAHRGALHLRIKELENDLAIGLKKPFTKIIKANIADLQALGQEPITFLRQVLVAVSLPSLWNSLPTDVVSRAKTIIGELEGPIGQMSNGTGLTVVKKSVAEFIRKNDGVSVDYNDIVLTDGVMGGLEISFKLLQTDCDTTDAGVLVPIPIYPLYNALLTQHGLKQINYNLNIANNFELDLSELRRAYENSLCSCNCRPRALVIINPGNPSGRVLKRNDLEDIVKFAYDNNLVIIADEIYQFNLLMNVPFISIHKVIREASFPYNTTEAISLMSISKGYTAEIGLRGGYAHLINMDHIAHKILDKTMMVKECPNMLGQIGLFSMTNPPVKGEPSFELYQKEKDHILSTFREIGAKWVKELNHIPGINCSIVEGGPVVFPRISIPEKAVKAAASKGIEPDVLYAIELVEATGLGTSVGSAFGMQPDQHFLRVIIPASKGLGDEILEALKAFNEAFLRKYS